MAATIVLLILLAWLICTAAMTFLSGHDLRKRHSSGALGVRRVSDGPASSQPAAPTEPREW